MNEGRKWRMEMEEGRETNKEHVAGVEKLLWEARMWRVKAPPQPTPQAHIVTSPGDKDGDKAFSKNAKTGS